MFKATSTPPSHGSFSSYLDKIDPEIHEKYNADDDFQNEKEELVKEVEQTILHLSDTLAQISSATLNWREKAHSVHNEAVIDQKLMELDVMLKEMNDKLKEVKVAKREGWDAYKENVNAALDHWRTKTNTLVFEINEIFRADAEKS